jgi:hypothetical protein
MSVLLTAEREWTCPNCTVRARTTRPDAPIPYHACKSAKLRGLLTVPLVPAGVSAKVEAVERADYVNGDMVQTDAEGRPVMSIITTRDDGQDCAVLAPAATGSSRE